MNIYAEQGHKVVFNGREGTNWDLDKANRVFSVGQVLEVEHIYVGSWETEVKFKGYDGTFNSVMFDDYRELNTASTAYEIKQEDIEVGNKYIIKTQQELFDYGFRYQEGALRCDGGLYINDSMLRMGGGEATISMLSYVDNEGRLRFRIEEDNGAWEWDYRMMKPIEVKVDEELIKEPTSPILPEEPQPFKDVNSKELLKYLEGYKAGFVQAMKLLGMEV